jgi:predicted transcriptional regulator
MAGNMVRLSLDLSPQANTALESVASSQHTTKSDVLRKAIALVQVAEEARRANRKIGIFDTEANVFSEIVGL